MEPGSPGQSQPSQSQRIESLEREGRFPELATELASAASRAEGGERAALLARLGEVRLRLDDIARGMAAFQESLELDPKQPTSRRWLEVLLAEPEQAVNAAEILEPVYQAEFRKIPHSASMLLAIQELRANRANDQDERIAIWVQLGAMFDHAATPAERAREIAARLLTRTALEWPGGVAKWIERVVRLSTDPSQRLETLLGALNQALSDPGTISELALAAGYALEALGRSQEASDLYQRALTVDPTSPEVLGRIDSIAEAAGETPEQRVERYRAALGQLQDPERSAALRVALGLLQKNVLDDLDAAAATLREAIAEAPALFRAHEALLEVYAALQDDEAVLGELERALTVFEGGERRTALVHLAETLFARGRAADALERLKLLLDEPESDEETLQLFERLAEETNNLEIWRRIHERRVQLAPDVPSRVRALETLGEFFNERLSDPGAAVATWKHAAELLAENSDDFAESERLYERGLALSPGEVDVAQRLVELCSSGNDWSRVPRACRMLLHATGDALSVVDVVLSLEGRAIQAGGAEEFATVVDDVVSRLEEDRETETRELVAAKARVLASAGDYDEAARVYEALIESFADEQDVRAYVGLIESNPDSEWRHRKRCWLFEWRAERAEDPVAVLTHWATVEEQEFGDVPAAIALLERAAGLDANRAEVHRELARLRLESSELALAVTALARLRELSTDAERGEVELSIAELLIERLDRMEEALPVLESLLTAQPQNARAREFALLLCKLPATQVQAAALLERVSFSADAPEQQRQLLHQLLDLSEEAVAEGSAVGELSDLRRRWFERLVGLESGDAALTVFERAAAEFPREEAIWQAVEAGAVRARKPEAAVRAYEGALARTQDPELAEGLGRRLVGFAEEHLGNPKALTTALQQLLAVAPEARWAFERIKVPLTNDQRWDELFALYERVIDSIHDEDERAALLDEAAVAARDLASDAERAINYWESYFALRSEDARVDLALERLYERQRKIERLIDHLSRRESGLDTEDLVALRLRIAGLWLEISDGRSALVVLESLPKSALQAESALTLLERVFRLELSESADEEAEKAQRKVGKRAARLLKQLYETLERPDDVARVLVAELARGNDDRERVQLLRRLSELRRALSEEAAEFESLGELLLLEPDEAAHRARLEELAHKLGVRSRLAELMVLAADGVGRAAQFAELIAEAARIQLELGQRDRGIELFGRILDEADETEARLRAARRLEQLLHEAARAADRCTVLERLAQLARDSAEMRHSLLEAARVALDELGNPERAAADYRSLLEREPNDRELIDGLLKALRAGERWGDVIVALERRAELEPEMLRARRDLGEAARIRAERLNDVDNAISAWRAVRERFGRDQESFDHLAQLLERSGRFVELAELLQEETQVSDAPAPLYARLAEVHRRHTGDLPAALLAYLRAGDLLAASELFCRHDELVPDDPALALELSQKLLAAAEAGPAERVIRRQIEHYGARSPREATGVYLALSELLVATARAPKALKELSVAAERYPESGRVLGALGALALEQGDLDRAEQSYRALLLLLGRGRDGSEPTQGRAEVYLWLGQVMTKRGDLERAQDHLASAFEAALASEEEAILLETALRRQGRHDLAERAVTARLERARDPAKVATALRDLLEVSADSGPIDPSLAERAMKLAERASRDLESAGGTQATAWQALLDVFERLGDKERALGVLEVLAARVGNEAERNEYDLMIARRLLDLPNRQQDAVKRLWELVHRDAALDQAYELLRNLCVEPGELEELRELLAAQLLAAEASGDTGRSEILALRLGATLERLGRLREAAAAYSRLSHDPLRRRQALEKLVALHDQLGTQGSELAEVLESLLETETDPDRGAKVAIRLADLRKQEWDEEGVERALARGFALSPARAELSDALVARLLERGAYEKAIEVLERAIAHAPAEAGLKLKLAEARFRAGNPEGALVALDSALLARAPEASVRRERSRILEALGRADEALTELDAALGMDAGASPELLAAIERTNLHQSSERWATRAADICAELGQRSRARSILSPWLERNPDSAALLARVAKLANADRDFGPALEAYRKLSRLEHGSARRTAVLSLARVAESAGRPEEAVGEVEAALSEGIDSVELRRELGKLYALTGDRLKQARMLLDDAHGARGSNQIELLTKAVELFASEGAVDEALSALSELRALDPERVEVVLLVANVLSSAGRGHEAKEALREVLAATDKRRGRSHAKLFYRLAELYLAQDEFLEALEPLGTAHQLDKADPEIALSLGLLASDLEHGETAFGALRIFVGLKEKSSDVSSRRQLSRAYAQLAELEFGKGQKTVARRMATRALETDHDNKAAQRMLAELNAR